MPGSARFDDDFATHRCRLEGIERLARIGEGEEPDVDGQQALEGEINELVDAVEGCVYDRDVDLPTLEGRLRAAGFGADDAPTGADRPGELDESIHVVIVVDDRIEPGRETLP